MKVPLGLSLLSIVLSPCAHASDGTWNSDSNGNWSDTIRWLSGTIANGVDGFGNFEADLTANRTITNNAGTGGWSGTTGHLRFNDIAPSNQWVLSGGTLTLSVSSGKPTIEVVNGTTASIGSSIAGTQGFIKNGQGTLNLTGVNHYTGDTIINGGRIYLGTATGAITSSVVTVNHGGVLEFGANGVSDHYGDSLGLKLNGGTLQFGNASSTGVNRETMGTLSFSGNSTVLLQRATGSGDRVALTIGALSRQDHGILTIQSGAVLGDIGGSERFQISATETPTVANGMIGAEYISASGGVYNYVTYVGSGTTGSLQTASYTAIANSAAFTATNNNTNAIGNVGTIQLTSNVDTYYAALRTQRNIIGTGKIHLSTGGLLLYGNLVTSITNSIDFGTEAIVYSAANNPVALSGTLTASNGFTKGGSGTVVISSINNNFGSGPVTVNEGILRIDGGDNRLPTNSALNVRHSGTFDINGFNQSVANLTGEGAVTNSASASSSVLTVNNTADGVFSGVIENGSGTVALTKSGAGVLTLSGSNTYTGATVVSAGTLLINGNQAAATGVVTVNVGATLGGNGTVGGATTIEGALKPGNSEGLLTFSSSLTLKASSVITLEIGSDALRGNTYDAVNVGGLLTYGGDLVLSVSGLHLDGSWNLFEFADENWAGAFQSVTLIGSYTGSLSLTGFVWTGFVGDQEWTFDQSTGILSVPEPSNWAMVGLGAVALSLSLRRKGSRKASV